MKKTLIYSLCICSLFSLAGCSGSAKNDDSAAKTTDSSSAAVSESEKENDRIEELEGKLDKLVKAMSNEMGIDEESFWDHIDEYGIVGEVHEIYDDTAVIEAYKSGDDSKLTDEKDKYIYEQLVKAIDEIIKDDMTDYDKELAVYNYIFSGTHYNLDNLSAITENNAEDQSHTPYGFFHDHTTICVGNATTFKLFMDALGIDCKIIHSIQEGEHAWNIVNIDGDWYHCDVTFDGGSKVPDYAYFNVPDSAKENAGYPWDKSEFPECNSYKYCYVFKNAEEIKDVYEIPKTIENGIKNGKNTIYMKMKLDEGTDDIAASSQISSILNSIIPQDEMSYAYCTNTMIVDDYIAAAFTYGTYSNEEFEGEMNDETVLPAGILDIDYGKLTKAFGESLEGFTFEYDPSTTYYQLNEKSSELFNKNSDAKG